MAKKKGSIDTKFEDLNFDDELNIDGFGDFHEPKHGGRAVVEEAKSSFLSSVKHTATDGNFIRRLVGLTMPKGYSQLFNAYDGTRDAIGKIYSDNETELRPHMAKMGRTLNQRKSRMRFLLPRSVRDAMDQADYKEKTAEGARSQPTELQGQLSSLDQLFSLEANSKAEQKIDDARKELKSDSKFRLSSSIQTDISSGINELVAYQNNVTINFQKRSLELGYRGFDIQQRMLELSEAFYKDSVLRLDAISKNTAMPDYVKLKTTEAIKDRLRQRLADAAVSGISNFRSNYFKDVISNISGVVGSAVSLGNLAGGMTDGMSRAQMLGMGIGSAAGDFVKPQIQWAGEQAAEMLAPAVAKIPGLKNTGDNLRMFFADPVGALNRIRHSDVTNTGLLGWAQEALRSILPSYTPADKIEGLGIESLGDVAQFDNAVYTSITQIMPAYLESIDKNIRVLVSGQDEEGQAWSHYTGSMVTRSTLDNQHLRVGVFRGQGQNARREIGDLISQMGGEDLSQPAKNALSRRLYIDLQKGQGFNPGDYVKSDSWSDVDEETADELINFIADRFELDFEGKFTGQDKSFLADITEAFKDTSERLPKSLERARILAERVMGRDTLRRLGLASYDGHEGDQINMAKWADTLLGDEDVSVVAGRYKPSDDEVDARTAFQKMKDLPKEALKKQQELLEKQRAERERAAVDGKFDVIDTIQNATFIKGSVPPVQPLNTATPKEDISSSPTGGVKPLSNLEPESIINTPTFKFVGGELGLVSVSDETTHSLLRQLVDLNTQPSPRESVPNTSFKEGVELAKGIVRKGVVKAKEVKVDLTAKAKTWYENSPKVQFVMGKIEETYGKVTDKDTWNKLVESIYRQTGTPEEIYAKISNQLDKAKEVISKHYTTAKDVVTETGKDVGDYLGKKADVFTTWAKDTYAKRDEYKAVAGERVDQTKEYVFGKARQAREFVKEAYDDRDEHLQTAKDKVKDLGEGIKETFAELRDTLSGWMEKRLSLSEVSDTGTHERLDNIIQLIAEGGIGGGSGEAKPGLIRRGLGHLGTGLKQGVKYGGKGLWELTKLPFKATAGLVGLGFKAARGTYNTVFGENNYGVRDVLVIGEDTPRLKAKDIRSGLYVDKNTNKVIKRLKDITGAVIDTHTGNEVISEEEFTDKKLVDGKGDSLAMYLGRGAVNKTKQLIDTGFSVANNLIYKPFLTMGKMAIEAAKDQFLQFDAYFPGDKEPRIKSSLMKKGYYRDADGKVISSLKDIKGPVYDIDGNEVISEDDLDKYQSLYTRNGSLLFTIGRGVISTGKFAFDRAMDTGKFLMGPGIAMTKGIFKYSGKLLSGAVDKLGNLFKGKHGRMADGEGVGGYGDSLAEDILFEQLKIQQDILNTLRERAKNELDPATLIGQDTVAPVEHDSDGDGVRDNSWADIFAKRAARRARSPNADVVDAINGLGSSIDKNFDSLKDTVEDSGSKGSSGIIDTLKSWGGKLAAALGLGGLAKSLLPDVGDLTPPGAAKPDVKKKGLLRRAVGGLGKLAWGTTKYAAKATWGVTKFVAKRVVVPVAITAVKVAGAAVSAVGLPVILAGVAIGGIAYIGYTQYKGAKFDKKPLYFLRMTQYGVDGSDEDRVEKILQLESLLSGAIKGIDTPYLDFDPAKVDMKRIYQLFGLIPPTPEGGEEVELDESEIDPERRNELISWLAYRFKPVYLKHCSALYAANKTYDLNKVDELITTKDDTLAFVQRVVLHDMKSIYNDVSKITPFDGKLKKDNDDVLSAFKRVRKLADKRPNTKGESTLTSTGDKDNRTDWVNKDASILDYKPRKDKLPEPTKPESKSTAPDVKPVDVPKVPVSTVSLSVVSSGDSGALDQLPDNSAHYSTEDYIPRKQTKLDKRLREVGQNRDYGNKEYGERTIKTYPVGETPTSTPKVAPITPVSKETGGVEKPKEVPTVDNRYTDEKSTNTDMGIVDDKELVREMGRRTEAIAIKQMEVSAKQSGEYLHKTVAKLTNIDNTLLRIEDIVRSRAMGGSVRGKSNAEYIAEVNRKAEEEKLANQSSGGRSQVPVNFSASYRPNVSTKREENTF